MTPARHSSIGRDIIRNIDIDRNYERAVNTTALATAPDPEITEPISPPKEGSIDPQIPQKQPEPDSIAEIQKDVPAAPSAPRNILADLGEAEIESFEAHRVDEANATVDILVKWANGEQTWESEWSLQQQVPMLIYKYWDGVDGRDAATGLDVYHVFRILKRATRPQAKKDFRYQVQWVGYRRSESTWEYGSKLAQIAPEELIKFEAKNESAPEAPARKPKRGIARSSGHVGRTSGFTKHLHN